MSPWCRKSVRCFRSSPCLPACGDENLTNARLVIAFVGMSFEARIAAGPGVRVVCREAGSNIAGPLTDAIKRGCRSIVSFGVAGGLSPRLRAGDWIVASSIVDAGKRHQTDVEWSRRLRNAVPGAGFAPVAGSDAPVSKPATKREWYTKTGAVAVDMESHVVARIAAEHGLPFAAVRVIVDPAHRTVPGAALAGMRSDGKTDVSAVLRALAASPSETLPVLRLAVDAFLARYALQRGRRMLGPGFGLFEVPQTETPGSILQPDLQTDYSGSVISA
jgi:adenosylhomocysteine nucleosidase